MVDDLGVFVGEKIKMRRMTHRSVHWYLRERRTECIWSTCGGMVTDAVYL